MGIACSYPVIFTCRGHRQRLQFFAADTPKFFANGQTPLHRSNPAGRNIKLGKRLGFGIHGVVFGVEDNTKPGFFAVKFNGAFKKGARIAPSRRGIKNRRGYEIKSS
jgi:hypothetical protein